MKVVAIASGGLDSTVMLDHLKHGGDEVTVLTFNYSQRHEREIIYARKSAQRLGFEHFTIGIPSVGALIDSAITTEEIAVPMGHYEDESMKATVVPNRNAIFLSIAFGVAMSNGALAVYAGMHAGDHPVYPDCRPEFIDAFRRMEETAVSGADYAVKLVTPFLDKRKSEIVALGAELGVLFEDTYSCYVGDVIHCGQCGTCTERIEAFQIAEVPDPTLYAPEVE